MKINTIIITNGKGSWSRKAQKVAVTGLELADVAEDESYGEVHLTWRQGDWNVPVDGYIYSDPGFFKGLQDYLLGRGLPRKAVEDIEYSERMMQGDDYVSFFVGGAFIRAWYAAVQHHAA